MKIGRLIRSKRRSISLTVTRDAQLLVRAPRNVSLRQIQEFITEKSNWIAEKQDFFRRHPPPEPRKYVEGEAFLFLGRTYHLHIAEDLPKAVLLNGTLKLSKVALANAADHVLAWYQEQAREYIRERVEHYARQEGLKYKSIRVNKARTHWGSCGYAGTLNFTWRLIMAPPRVIDYVIVHELMHLKQRNHSQKFWDEVRAVIPDYEKDEAWIKSNSNRLIF